MSKINFKKVHIKKPSTSLEYTTDEYLLDALELVSAKSQLPIKQLLSLVLDSKVDSVSCTKDDTNYYFFARVKRDGISIIVKQLGEQTIEFELSRDEIKEFSRISPFL